VTLHLPAGSARRIGAAALSFGLASSLFASAQAQSAPPPAPGVSPVIPTPVMAAPVTVAPVTVPGAVEATPPAAVAPAPEPLPAPVLVPAPTPMAVAAPVPDAPKEPNATLDYNDGIFYLRSHHDNLVLTWGGRAHIDVYTFAGPGVSHYHRGNGTGLKPNLFFRRAILETGGIVRKQWFYYLSGNFVPNQLDANQAVANTQVGVYDAFAGWMPIPTLKIYFGQYNEPFTMENVTSSRWTDLMERSVTVRYIATPYNKSEGLMAWGETANKAFEYQLGAFGGDGQNRANIDDRFDGTIRALVRPFFARSDALKRAHIGGSLRQGRRDTHYVRYDAPNIATGGGYTFFSSTYTNGTTDTRIIPARRQTAAAAELYLPFEKWDLKAEFIYINEERREVAATARDKSLRGGLFWGFGAYAQLSFWVLGTPRINGNPAGYYGLTKIPDGTTGAEAPYGLQLVLRGEVIRMNYDSNRRYGNVGGLDAATQNIDVNIINLAANYWATKHVRLTAQYSWYGFPGAPFNSKTDRPENEASAPGVRAGSPGAKAVHEISFRTGLAF
jgi:phosphate-selective porin